MNQQLELTINSLGFMADGIGDYNGQSIFVPYSLPSDKLKVSIESVAKDGYRAKIVEITEPSKDRQEAACSHFGKCGGCSLQHLKPEIYNNFKRSALTNITENFGLSDKLVSEVIEVGEHSRRRVEFKVAVDKGNVQIGFFAPKSYDVIDIKECIVTEKSIVAILPALRALIAGLKKPGNIKAINITALDDGLDVVICGKKKIETDSSAISRFAQANNVVRLGLQSDEAIQTIYEAKPAYVKFNGIDVVLPNGAFLQATTNGQDAIIDIIISNIGSANNVADLYCGCGTYSFAIKDKVNRIAGYEGSEDMVLAMHNAINRNNLQGRISANVRDLAINPLDKNELDNFDTVIINPPRTGASAQTRKIAKSDIKKVIMVSCKPATFKIDAKYLLDAGYKITSINPIDQFCYSNHLELVAVFEKK